MGRTCRSVDEELYNKACQSLKSVGKAGDMVRRLQAILSVKRHGIIAVARIFGISRGTLMNWIRRFKKESVEGLNIKPGRG